jgi:hypothetical protein
MHFHISRIFIMKTISIVIPLLVVTHTTQAMDWGKMDQYKATLVWRQTLQCLGMIDNS